MRERFWQRFALSELTHEEWEALCDGCGRCCLLKLEDDDTGDIATLDVACQLLDLGTCRCSDYEHRFERVPGCTQLTPERVGDFRWLPPSCAYRRVHEGRGLAAWHPLISGDPRSVQRAGIGVSHFAVSEPDVPDEELDDHIIAVLPISQ
ncbi:YcgN family cysteine cluster protein [Aidingimonas lacisalsi]|uniref:YcgN family cysteine cluster protein n=1 Tax=Aidingimonas lacisalsi TaxID=2604086 RepID=UPI0011D2572D|nr:YcgN family cysteine cluster protein [Aidingimonas lacisalsi]